VGGGKGVFFLQILLSGAQTLTFVYVPERKEKKKKRKNWVPIGVHVGSPHWLLRISSTPEILPRPDGQLPYAPDKSPLKQKGFWQAPPPFLNWRNYIIKKKEK